MENSSVVRATPRSLWSRAVLQIATDIYSTRALFPASHGGLSFVPALSLSASVYVHASRGAPSWVPNKETRIQTSALNPRRHATESAVRHRAGGTKKLPSSISSCGLNLSATPQAFPMPRPIKRARTDEKGLANRVQAAREENSLFGEEDQQPGISLMDPVEVRVPRMYSPQARIATAQLQYMIPRSGNRSIQGKVKAQLKFTRSLDCSR